MEIPGKKAEVIMQWEYDIEELELRAGKEPLIYRTRRRHAMRGILIVAVALLVLFSLTAGAQPNVGEAVIRGCLAERDLGVGPQGLVLTALDPSRQTFDSPSWLQEGQRFSLIGNPRLLNELARHTGEEIEVTGQLNPANPIQDVRDPVLIEPPRGGFPGVGQQTPRRPQRATGRLPVAHDELAVSDYKSFWPDCRR